MQLRTMVRTLQGASCFRTYRLRHSRTYTSCGQNLAPVYEQLADAYAHAKDKVIIAKVDADGVGRPLGQKYGVTGFPSACSCCWRRVWLLWD